MISQNTTTSHSRLAWQCFVFFPRESLILYNTLIAPPLIAHFPLLSTKLFVRKGPSASQAPSANVSEPVYPRANYTPLQNFDDKETRVWGVEGVALLALGLLTILTFFPFCAK